MIPYTYLIGWSALNLWYYGVRFSKRCTPSELWRTYFTSSKYVAQLRKYICEPDIIQVRRIFNDAQKARIWEAKVLQRMHVVQSEKWLNRGDHISIYNEVSPTLGKIWTPTERLRHSIRLTGLKHRPWTSEECLAQSRRSKGRKDRPEVIAARALRQTGRKYPPRSAESKARTSAALKGKKRTPEQNLTNSKAHKGIGLGKPKPTVICPKCGKQGGVAPMKRHHFDHCRFFHDGVNGDV